eukprot:GHVQ01006317.1.p1 GENE.GHVQ01006317.1~~GHVQ01006317.1.p1  ORF type:complete len:1118 (+),score=146.33 GHVQ01006317.1:2227-5580(+)
MVLATIHLSDNGEEPRPNRCEQREVEGFVVRMYVFGGRRLQAEDMSIPSCKVEVSCGGITRETRVIENNAYPVWLECLELSPIQATGDMCSKGMDGAQRADVQGMEPIVLTVYHQLFLRKSVVGRAAVEHRRVRHNQLTSDISAESDLDLVWVGLNNSDQNSVTNVSSSSSASCGLTQRGSDGGAGQLLIAVELVRWQDRDELPVQSMWPETREVTLLVSLLGLRDIINTRLAGIFSAESTNPRVIYSVSPYHKSLVDSQGSVIDIQWDPDKPSHRKWTSNTKQCFDFFSVVEVTVRLPVSPVYDCVLTIELWTDSEHSWTSSATYSGKTIIPLNSYLPWIAHEDHSDLSVGTPEERLGDASQWMTTPHLSHEQASVSLSCDTQSSSNKFICPRPPVWISPAATGRPFTRYIRNLMSTAPYYSCTDHTKLCNDVRRNILRGVVEKNCCITKPSTSGLFTTQGDNMAVGNGKGHDGARNRIFREDEATGGEDPAESRQDAPSASPNIIEKCMDIPGAPLRFEYNLDKEQQSAMSGSELESSTGGSVCYSSHTASCEDNNMQQTATELTRSAVQRAKLTTSSLSTEACLRQNLHGGVEVDDDEYPIVSSCGLPTRLVHELKTRPPPSLTLRDMAVNSIVLTDPIFAASGPHKANIACTRTQTRPCVTSNLESVLEDLHWRGLPLLSNEGGLCGYIKTVIMLETDEHNISPVYHGPKKSLLGYAFNESEFLKFFRSRNRLPHRIRLRLYIVRGAAIQTRSSPHVEVTAGTVTETVKIADHDSQQSKDIHSPGFWRLQELDLSLPEQGRVVLSVCCNDELGKARLIGCTTVDLEERWFSNEWQQMMDTASVPTELRSLIAEEGSNQTRGTLELWAELLDACRVGDISATELRPPAPTELELRLIVWGCEHVPLVDGGDHVDVQVLCNLDSTSYAGKHPSNQETDTHNNSRDGRASFNWRFVYPRIQTPTDGCLLQIRVVDDNTLSHKIFIGELNMDVKKQLEIVERHLQTYHWEGRLPLSFVNSRSKRLDEQGVCYIHLSIEIVTQPEANSRAVGVGRSEPNRDPVLTTPTEGRDWGDVIGSAGLNFDLQLLGRKTKWLLFGAAGGLVMFIILYLLLIIVR